MYSTIIYKPLEQFVFSKRKSLNFDFYLQSHCHYSGHYLLVLARLMIYHPSEFLLPQHQVTEVFHQPHCVVQLNLLLFPLFVICFFFSWKNGSWLHSDQNGFIPLVSSLNQPPLQGSTFFMLCS